MTRDPNRQQRAQERSVLCPLLADTLILVLIAIAAASTGSLTLLGESLRILLILLAGYWSLWCLMGVHRGSLGRYRFGTAKLECFAAVLCGLGLLCGGLFLCDAAVSMLFAGHRAASPAGLAIAALVNAVNVVINALGWIAMLQTSAARASEAFRTQLEVRWILLVTSLFVQLMLTGAALAQDPVIALGFDLVGSSFVAVLMITNGFRMIADALPSVLDRAAPPELPALLRDALGRIVPEAEVLSVRTRRTGAAHVADIEIRGEAGLSIDALRKATAGLRDELARLGTPLEPRLLPVERAPCADTGSPRGSDA